VPDSVLLGERLTRRGVAALFAAWLAVLAFAYTVEAIARLAAATPPTDIGPEFLWAPLLDAALWTLLSAAVFPLVRHFPLERGRLLGHGALLMLAGLVLVPGRNLLLSEVVRALGGLRSDMDLTYLIIIAISQDLFVYWLMVLALHTVRHSRLLGEREVARATLQAQLAEARLQQLKVQIQPHFLFNTLNAISALVREDARQAERMIEQLSEILRTTLAHHQAHEVAVREELAVLRPYLEIEQVRFGERLAVELDIPAELHGARVPHLILQPLVENAIRHGVAPRRRPGRVRVAARGQEEWLSLVVEDDGRGMEGPVRPGAVGLENTRARLAQLYGEAHRFEIRSAPEEGTRVEITIPLRR
jgi:signal transduction histidine kinase